MPRLGMVADRYLYLSLVGVLLVAVCMVTVFVVQLKDKFSKIVFVVFLLLYSVYLGGYTYYYSQRWKDADTVKEYLRGFYKEDSNENGI